MMRLESDEARCYDCPAVVNLDSEPEALHDPCGEVRCHDHQPCPCAEVAA